METNQEKNESVGIGNRKIYRPTAITVICIIGFIGSAVSLPMLFTNAVKQIGSWYPPYMGITVIMGLICMIGLWKMKSWAIYAYILLFGINQIVFISMGVWNIASIIIPGIVIGIALYHLKRMDANAYIPVKKEEKPAVTFKTPAKKTTTTDKTDNYAMQQLIAISRNTGLDLKVRAEAVQVIYSMRKDSAIANDYIEQIRKNSDDIFFPAVELMVAMGV